MNNHLIEIKNEMQKVNVNDLAIEQVRKSYSGLKIVDKDDKEGYELVHTARMDVRDMRLKIEAKRKEMKADSLEYGKLVDGEAKRLTALLEPIETHLEAEENRIKEERDREKREREEAKKKLIAGRTQEIVATGAMFDGMRWSLKEAVITTEEIETATADTFSDKLQLFKSIAHNIAVEKEREEAERKRIDEEQQKERERLRLQREEQDRKDAELRAQEAKIAEEKRQAREQQERDALLVKAQQEKEEAVARAKEEATKAEAARQAEIVRKEEERKVAEAEEARRLAELAPEKEKMLKYIESIKGFHAPITKGKKINEIFHEFSQAFIKFENAINSLK